MADFVTLADVKSYLFPGQTIADWDALLGVLIPAVSETIRQEVGCDILEGTYTNEKASGRGTSRLDLSHWPITAVASVKDPDGVTLVEGAEADFVVERFCLRAVGRTWALGAGNYTVTYTAGYATLPADLKLVCLEAIARKWKTVKEDGWGEANRSYPDGSVSHSNVDGDLNKAQLRVLEKYKRPRV